MSELICLKHKERINDAFGVCESCMEEASRKMMSDFGVPNPDSLLWLDEEKENNDAED